MRFLILFITLSCLSRGNSKEIQINWKKGNDYQNLETLVGDTVLVYAKTNACQPGFSVIEFNDAKSYNQCSTGDSATFKELNVTDCKVSISLDSPGQKYISTIERSKKINWCEKGMKFKITTTINDDAGDCKRDSFKKSKKRYSKKCNLINTIAFHQEWGIDKCSKVCCDDSRCVSFLSGKGRCFLFDDRKKPEERMKLLKSFSCHVKEN